MNLSRLAVALLVLAALNSPAGAHERSRSNSVWTETATGLSGRIYLEARQATLLLSLAAQGTSLQAAYAQRLKDGLQLTRGGAACTLEAPPQVKLDADGRLEGRGNWRCRAAGAIGIEVQVFAPLSANHIHFIRLQTAQGNAERILSRGQNSALFGEQHEVGGGSWLSFFILGVEHILGGADHLAFVLGLILLARGLRQLALLTLGFTVGHSITLALAVLGWVSPPGAVIEALIGFSILFIAAEAALSRTRDF